MSQDVFLVEIEAYDSGLPGTRTLRYATKGFATGPGEAPASTHYDERVKQPLVIRRTMFAPNSTRGRSTVGIGDVVLENGDGELDALLDYGFDGRTITVRRGTAGAAYPSGFPKLFEGTMAGVAVEQSQVIVKARDWHAATMVSLQTIKYTGGGLGTLEGTSDTLAGKPKPICYGTVRNIAPPCVETAKLIYQVADAQVNTVDAVYDRGVALKPSYAAMFVAVGGQSTDFIQTSPDGTTWTSRTSPVTDNWVAVAYGGGLWVAAGDSGGLATSENGIDWTSRTSGFGTSSVQSVTYGAGKFVIAGADGKMAYSTDGVTWTKLTALPFGTATIRSIVFADDGAGLFVGASGSIIAYSPDGVNWETTTIASQTFHAITYGNGIYVAVGEAAGAPRIYTSTDGISWTNRSVPASHTTTRYLGVAYGGGVYVAVGVDSTGTGPRIASSSDAITWTSRTSADSVQLNTVAHGGGVFVVGGGIGTVDGAIQTSSDGTTWTGRTEANTEAVTRVAFGEGGAAVATYGSEADVLDNSLQPAAGKFKAYYSATGSYFRLGAAPDGLVTADVTQGAAASNRTTAQIWAAILDQRAGMSTGDWNATDVTDLDTADNSVIGYWTDQETRVADVLDQVAGSIGAAWYLDAGGVFRIRQFVAPSGSPVLSLTANDLLRPLMLKNAIEPGLGIPQYSSVLRYARNYTPQSTDVAASVSDARRAYLAREWREVTDTDSAVQTKHLLAVQSVEESLLAEEADAQAEVERRQTLRGVTRQLYEAVVPLNDDTNGVDLNNVIELTHGRYGLSGGESFRVIGADVNAGKREIRLDIWK